jgi:hypothetical protein
MISWTPLAGQPRSEQKDRVALILLPLVTLLFSYPVVMTTFAPYDDEGYIMMTVRSFCEGHRLYGDIHTQYGPSFYLLSDAIHGWLGIPLTHDAVRLKTVLLWSLSSLFCYMTLRQLDVESLVAFFFACLFHFHMDKLALEPGHPQEWILLLSVLCLWFCSGSWSYKWVASAFCVSLIGMMKLNCGLIVALPLTIQATITAFHDSKQRYAAWQVIGIGTITSLCIAIWTIGTGSSLPELAWGMVGQHRRFTSEFLKTIPWNWVAIVIAGANVLLLLTIVRQRAFKEYRTTIFPMILWFTIVSTAAVQLFDLSRPLQHGLEPRGAATWLVLIGPAFVPWFWMSWHGQKDVKWLLGGCVLMGPFIAVPTPGTQLSLATAMGWVLLALMSNPRLGLAFQSWPIPLVCGSILTVSLVPGWTRWHNYSPLQLPGTHLLRWETRLASREREVATAIRECQADRLVFDGHGHNRFFFWTQSQPLTHANPTFWPRMLTQREQREWKESIEKSIRICVVVPPEVETLAGGNAQDLRTSLQEGWIQQASIGEWRIGIKDSRESKAPTFPTAIKETKSGLVD